MKSDGSATGHARRVLWVVFGLLAASFVALTIFALTREREKLEPSGEKPSVVVAMEVSGEQVREIVVLPGRIAAVADVRVPAVIGGRVVGAPAGKGKAVKEGDILMRMDSRMAELTKKRAELELREAEKAVSRWEAMKETGAVSESDWDTVKERRDAAAIALSQAEVFLSNHEIASPVDGIVEDRFVDGGEYIHEGAPAFRVVDSSRLKIEIEVPEQLRAYFPAPGSKVPFKVLSLQGRSFSATVTRASGAARDGTGAFLCEAETGNADGSLLPGMIVSAELVRPSVAGAVAVPLSAVIPQKDGHVVFVVEGDAAVRRAVVLRSITGGTAVISSGLVPGDMLVVEGHRGLRDGAPVEVAGKLPGNGE